MGVIDASIVFASRAEFCRDISDVVAPYTALARAARKSNRPNRRAKDHLRSAFGAGSIEWILNIGRIGEVVSPSARKFMRFGTTGSGAKQLRDEEAAPRNIAHTCVHPTRQASNFPATEPNSNNVCSLQPDVGPYEAVTLVAEAPRLSVYIYRLGYLVFRAGIKLCAGATRHHA